MKTTKIEYQKRLNTLQQWLVEGASTSEIHTRIIDNGWATSIRHACRLIAAARKKWEAGEQKYMRGMHKVAAQHRRQTIKETSSGAENKPLGTRIILDYKKDSNKLSAITIYKKPSTKIEIIINRTKTTFN